MAEGTLSPLPAHRVNSAVFRGSLVTVLYTVVLQLVMWLLTRPPGPAEVLSSVLSVRRWDAPGRNHASPSQQSYWASGLSRI